MGRQSHDAQIEVVALQNEIISNKIEYPINSNIRCSTNKVAKKIERHVPSKERIKEVDKTGDIIRHTGRWKTDVQTDNFYCSRKFPAKVTFFYKK